MNRASAIDRIKNAPEEEFDIVIVGGGATGLGSAVDAAARGHRVLLIEQADFAKGTSSRSTKLVHGGVRYLRQGNVSLVLEALRERGLLCQNAPHLVRNLAFVIPNYKWWEGPFYGVGMKVYDTLAGRLGLSPSRMLNRKQALERIPTLEQDGLSGAVVYHDAQFDDSRLAINLAQTAAEHGAILANYVQCVGLVKENGLLLGVEVKDLESGDEFVIRAKAVVNATGVFVDHLRQLDEPESAAIVAPSQGIHLVLPKSFLPGESAIMVPKTSDGRVLFAVPWHNRVVVGTTDTPMQDVSLEPRALKEECDFVLEHAAKYLAQDPQKSDVLSVFAGLRPLVKDEGAEGTAALSRDHTILVSASGLITVTGGKWTTYRKMAEDVIDHAETIAALEETPCPTKNLKITGWTEDQKETSNLTLYGSEAKHITGILESTPNSAAYLHPSLPYQEAEVIHHVRHEMARTTEDVLSRRTRALLLDAKAASQAALRVSTILAQELGRDEAWEQAQTESFQKLAQGYQLES